MKQKATLSTYTPRLFDGKLTTASIVQLLDVRTTVTEITKVQSVSMVQSRKNEDISRSIVNQGDFSQYDRT